MEVFFSSPWMPVEWIEAHGFKARGVWSVTGNTSAAVPEGVCAFAHAMVKLAETRPGAALVLSTACDQMRRAGDAIAETRPKRTFLFNLPATWQTPAARRLYHSEVERLGQFLESLGGRAPTAAELPAVMAEFEARRTPLRDLLRSGSPQQRVKALAEFHCDRASQAVSVSGQTSASGVPLAVVGGPLLASQWRLFDAVAAAGGVVVLNAAEPGERDILPPWPPIAGDEAPLTVLANHYFDHIADVFQRPNSRLYDWLATRLPERGARGIILWVHVGCDLWRAEAESLREAFGLPVLVLEPHDVHVVNRREANRLAAFVESIR